MLNFLELEQIAMPNFAGSSLSSLFSGTAGLISIIFFFAGSLLLLYLLYGGINLMLSGGDPKKIASGRAIVTNAILGFIIVFASYWIVQIVGLILGLDSITAVFGN